MTAPLPSLDQDPYWNEDTVFFTGTFGYYRNKPQKVWAKFHVSDERYYAIDREIVPIKTPNGTRTYVHMQPYILEPNLVMTVALEPKRMTDRGEVVGSVQHTQMRGTKDAIIGNAQAWYYHDDKTLVVLECFLEQRFRDVPLGKDENMRTLWHHFETWLTARFPRSLRIVTPFADPLFTKIEYHMFLRSLGYTPVAQAAFGKQL
jgi:hypothetical protein